MEEHHITPSEINSIDANEMLNYLKRKRKFQAEQLGVPLSKHKCCDGRNSLGREEKDVNIMLIKEKSDEGKKDDGSEAESSKDSNSFVGDTDSMMFISGQAKTDTEEYSTTSPCNWHCTSLADGSDTFKNTVYSLSSRSKRITGADREKSLDTGGDGSTCLHDSGSPAPLYVEEHVLEYGSLLGYGCADYGHDGEQCSDKELEDVIYSNGVNPNNYVLSSGRWSVSQEPQQEPKKLTIDKEFEQYFSMLML